MAGRPNKVIENSSYIIICEVINKLLFIVLTIFISRILGVKSLGAYGFIFAFTGIFFVFSDIGHPVFIRDLIINKKAIHKFWGNLLVLKFFSSLIIYAIIVTITLTHFIPQELKLPIRLVGLILFGSIFSGSAKLIFISHQKIGPIALIGIIRDSLTVGLSIFFISSGKGLIWIVVSFAISELVRAVILNFLLIKRFSKPDLKIDVKLCIRWVKESFYFIMQKQFRGGLFHTDTLIISLMGGLYATGLYQASYKISINTNTIPNIFLIVFFPYYININRISFKKLKAHYTKYKLYTLMLSTMLYLFLFIFAEQIITLLYGNEFLKSIWVLRILAISTFFLTLNSNNTALLNALKKEKLCSTLLFFIFLLNLLLDIIFMKFYGIIGIATSTVICTAIYFVITENYIRKMIKS